MIIDYVSVKKEEENALDVFKEKADSLRLKYNDSDLVFTEKDFAKEFQLTVTRRELKTVEICAVEKWNWESNPEHTEKISYYSAIKAIGEDEKFLYFLYE